MFCTRDVSIRNLSVIGVCSLLIGSSLMTLRRLSFSLSFFIILASFPLLADKLPFETFISRDSNGAGVLISCSCDVWVEPEPNEFVRCLDPRVPKDVPLG